MSGDWSKWSKFFHPETTILREFSILLLRNCGELNQPVLLGEKQDPMSAYHRINVKIQEGELGTIALTLYIVFVQTEPSTWGLPISTEMAWRQTDVSLLIQTESIEAFLSLPCTLLLHYCCLCPVSIPPTSVAKIQRAWQNACFPRAQSHYISAPVHAASVPGTSPGVESPSEMSGMRFGISLYTKSADFVLSGFKINVWKCLKLWFLKLKCFWGYSWIFWLFETKKVL